MAGDARTTDRGVRLDAQRIVAAALEVADEHGIAGMTMRRVGAALGSDPTAVYRYFSSRDELVAAIADSLFAEVAVDVPDVAWRERLLHVARVSRSVYRSHPAIVDALANQPEESESLIRANEVIVRALRDAGLEPAEVGLFHQVLVSYMIGTGLHDAAWGVPGDEARAVVRRAYAALDPTEYPTVSALGPHLFPPDDDVFDFALELLLDAVEAVARRTKRSRRQAG